MARSGAIARLNVLKVVLGAFIVVWWYRRAFAKALAIPLVALTVLPVSIWLSGAQLPGWAMWLFYFVHILVSTLFAVTCHRLVLMDHKEVRTTWLPLWTWRESRFVFFFFAVWLVAGIGFSISMTLILNLSLVSNIGRGGPWPDWLLQVAMIPMMYVFSRLCLVFPATAIDRKVSLKWSWRLTWSNGWRLFVVVSILPWIISHALGLLYFGEIREWEMIVVTLLGFVLLAVEVAALSLSYRELAQTETKEQS